MLSLAKERDNHFCITYIEKILRLIESEIELVNLSIRYPHINNKPKGIEMTLYVRDGFSQTDLVEIIKGLHAVKLPRRGDGSYATIADITSVFEAAFNIQIPRIDQKIYNTVNRSKGAAQFLERMISALEEQSQR